MNLVIASNNDHKILEIKEKFSNLSNLDIIPMSSLGNIPDIIENGATFEENALIKARALNSVCDFPILADDSGLVVDELNGDPGIFSARYGNLPTDHEKNMLVLSNLNNTPWEKRTAKFVCVIALIINNKEHLLRGECHGKIALAPKGDQGFGYDPIFYIEKYDKTVAEIPLDLKNKISHRAIALDKCFQLLSTLSNKGEL